MLTEQDKFRILLGRITATAWSDTAFRDSLVKEPATVLGANGLQPPPGLTVQVHVDTPALTHVICRQEWLSAGTDTAERLSTDARATLAALGYSVRDSIEYKVLFNSNTVMNLVIPLPPSAAECSIARLR